MAFKVSCDRLFLFLYPQILPDSMLQPGWSLHQSWRTFCCFCLTTPFPHLSKACPFFKAHLKAFFVSASPSLIVLAHIYCSFPRCLNTRKLYFVAQSTLVGGDLGYDHRRVVPSLEPTDLQSVSVLGSGELSSIVQKAYRKSYIFHKFMQRKH